LSVHALIPLKAVTHGKTRLASVLGEGQRAELVRTMLAQVVAAVITTPGIDRVHLLTSAADLVPRGCLHIDDHGAGLNEAIADAARALRAEGGGQMLIVHADLPFVTPEDIAALVAAARNDALVAAPDWTGAGTNALVVQLARTLTTRFGAGSFAAHRAAADTARMPFLQVRRPGLAYDVDEPEQLDWLAERGGPSYAFLRPAIRMPQRRPPRTPRTEK